MSEELLKHIEAELAAVYGGRPWLVAIDVLAGATAHVKWLDRLGATKLLCVSAARGSGPGPDPALAPDPIVLGVTSEDMMSSIRDAAEALANVPPDVQTRVDAFDPQREAQSLGAFYSDGRPVAQRPQYGARPASWQALEDKTTVDGLWDAIGVPRAPSEVLSASDLTGLTAATRRLDSGDGVVWAADSRDGFHGGAALTRPVWDDDSARQAQAALASHADVIRVMPYLVGRPCSIHGLVFDDYVATFRPCEMVVYRKQDGTFQYGQTGTFWDPPDEDREAMRTMARKIGTHLRANFGYRGAFTMDGVLTREGFRPTELNPRFGAALNKIGAGVDLPLVLLNHALVAGEQRDWRPREFEELLTQSADANRMGSTMVIVKRRFDEDVAADLAYDGSTFRRATEHDTVVARATVGPHSAGGIVFVKFEPEHTPIGDALAPRGAAALAWADAEWNLDLGPLEPAPDVR